MTIDRIDHPWAESGSLDTTLTDDKRDVGWISGDSPDQPTIERLNLLQNEDDNKLNEIIDETNDRFYRHPEYLTISDSSVEEERITKAFHPYSTAGGKTVDPVNSFSLPSSTHDIMEMEYVNNATIGKGLVFALEVGELRFWDINNESFSIITSSLNTIFGWASVNAVSMCVDDSYAYVVGYYSTNTPKIVAIDLTDGSVHPDWPSSGVALSTYSTTFENYQVKCRWVDSDKIAISQPWVSVTSGTSHAIRVIDASDGSVLGSGAGDYAGSAGKCVGVCGDGPRAYFAIQEASSTQICSMNLTSYGSTGGGGTGWPFSGNTTLGDIKCAGDTVVATWVDVSIGNIISEASGVDGNQVNRASGDTNWILNLRELIYTNLAWWAVGYQNGSDLFVLYRLDILNGPPDNSFTPDSTNCFMFEIPATTGGSLSSAHPVSRLAFSGDSIWISGQNGNVATNDFSRLPLVGCRH